MTYGSATASLAVKLGIKPGHRIVFVGAPRSWIISGLPENVRIVRRRSEAPADVVIAFFRDAAALEKRILELSNAIALDGSLWIAWPRKAAGHASNLSDNVVRTTVLPLGLVDVKVAALDDDWSALKMVWRKERRPAQS